MTKQFFIIVVLVVFLGACQSNVAPPVAVLPVPTENQLKWQELEQYAFIHYTVNAFTDKEWGYGDESPAIFNPTEFNAEQWASAIKDAGLKGIILTCKHHDGFCLWPSQCTEHSIKNSPFRDGKGDIVKEVSDACRKYGLKFGVYLSPWDRNHAQWGYPEYLTCFKTQLEELLTNYGDVFEVWFDGANGGDGYFGGAREKRNVDNIKYYNWPSIFAGIREMSPNTIIWGHHGDVRFCGNESGYGGETNWCMLTLANDTLYTINPDIERMLISGAENGDAWMPAEVCVSIRPGWFYHANEDDKVRTPENLLKVYLESVGRGSNLLLNMPPDRRGLIHENDVKALQGWKKIMDDTFTNNLATSAKVSADTYRGKSKQYAATNVTDGNKETYWATDDGVNAGNLVIDLGKPQKVKYVTIQEYLRLGQRVKRFDVEVWKDNAWVNVASGTTIGHKRILPLNPVETSRIRINIKDAKACPLISNVEIY